MALYQPTNVSPSLWGELGGGVIDAAQNFDISWQVNGDSAMVAYQIDIYQNNALSTLVRTTGKVALSEPFYGKDYTGTLIRFSVPMTAGGGLSNGNEYKLKITQWWGSTDSESVVQTSMSAFITREAPALAITSFVTPVTTRNISFTAAYTQAQGDTLNYVRWKLLWSGSGGNQAVLADTGNLYGVSQLQFDYDGFFNGQTYAVYCEIQTVNGVVASDSETFTVQYSTSPATGSVTMSAKPSVSGVMVSWAFDSVPAGATGFEIYREDGTDPVLKKIAAVSTTTTSVVDCSAASQQNCKYAVFAVGSSLSSVLESDSYTPGFWDWAILSCTKDSDGTYRPQSVFLFGKNLDSGSVGNNNSPNVLANFTRFPTVQKAPQNYMSGSLTSYIGTIDTAGNYSDTLSQRNAIYALSVTDNELFLKSRKGDVFPIRIAGAISFATLDGSRQQALNASVPWVQTGEIGTTSVILTSSDSLFPD